MGPRFKYYLVLESLFYFYECLAHWEKKKQPSKNTSSSNGYRKSFKHPALSMNTYLLWYRALFSIENKGLMLQEGEMGQTSSFIID